MGQQDRFHREYYPALGSSWQNRGLPAEDNPYSDQHVVERKGPPQTILQILREHAQIPATDFFLHVKMKDGSNGTFSSSTFSASTKEKLNDPAFQRILAAALTSDPTPSYEEPSIPYRRLGPEQDHQDDFGTLRPPVNNSKRRVDFGMEQAQSRPVPRKKASHTIVIGDEKAVWSFYEQRFKNCQQAACKLIAKAWIKTVEPKKQSTHPYTGKDEKAPDWWPQPWGDNLENKVRHKEPDHLYKKERLYLLGHILRMIVQPNDRQHPDIRKLQLTVAKLEEVTLEALSPWFADGNNPSNNHKKGYLKEIFKVATQEERFQDGRCDATTKVHVMNDDRIEDGYASDTDENNSSRLDDSQDRAMISRSMTPQKGLTQHMTTFADAHGSIDSADGSIHDTYMSDTVIRGSQYSQGVPGSDYPVEITRYGEMPGIPSGPPLDSSGSMGLPEIQYMQTHDPSRRSSMADPHLEFATTTTPNGYVSWTNTSAPSATTMYTMPGPGPGYQQNALMSVGQPGVPMTQPQTYSMIYDSLPRGHDLGSANMLRAGLAPNPSAYQDYAGTRGMIGSGVKQESLNRNLPTLH